MEDDKVVEKKVRALAKSLGLQLCQRPPGLQWDGRTIQTAYGWSNVVHDIAHWLVCVPERRNLPEFGLGPGPDTQIEIDPPRTVSDAFAVREEERASLLGIYLERVLGMDWTDTFSDHAWDNGTYDETYRRTQRWLEPRFREYMGQRNIRKEYYDRLKAIKASQEY